MGATIFSQMTTYFSQMTTLYFREWKFCSKAPSHKLARYIIKRLLIKMFGTVL